MPRTYSAYFVRSRVTGGGASEVQLLWPQANTWPPEVDFNETGGRINSTSSTVHFGPTNQIDQRELRINMVRWHTWGVIWTPKSIKYVVDGVVWASVTTASEIPNIAMTLRLQQQTWCFQGRLCPTAPVSMLVKWVAEYQAT
ncbi:MAG TPA: glycoside hydrolase family 16 protein [Acidimicrobiales bacterium]|nr:glycoside hydrolase family 16 protein [Acidimicrobiales bacterium]